MPTELRAEAAEWERRSLAASNFAAMVECQRQADRCLALALQRRNIGTAGLAPHLQVNPPQAQATEAR